MTEGEWFPAKNPSRMLDSLRGNLSASPTRKFSLIPTRKLRLYIHACCRLLPLSSFSGKLEEAVSVCDQFIDGRLSLASLNEFRATFHSQTPYGIRGPRDEIRDLCGAVLAANNRLWDACKQTGNIVTTERFVGGLDLVNEIRNLPFRNARVALCTLLHDIFGNTFRPVTIDPAWLTSTVVLLAREMYESRDFSAMPVLADALQDADCDNADILDHCRGPGPHVRGCWVCDLVLGKE